MTLDGPRARAGGAAGAALTTIVIAAMTAALAIAIVTIFPGHVGAMPLDAPRPAWAIEPPPTPPRPPRFEGGVAPVGPLLRERLVGRNWHPGCPVGIADLRHVRVSYWDFHGGVRTGPLVVHETVANDVLWVFRRLFRAGFRIHRIELPPRYRPPTRADWFSTRNRSSSFNCRPATGNPGSLSHHSYGWAIDINPLQNPYVSSSGRVLRRAAKPYTDRSLREQGMIHPGDVVVRSFARIGWEWGGDWETLKDYMHFSLTGR
jgi:D-alanyl-D-alanine carboxypeptidase